MDTGGKCLNTEYNGGPWEWQTLGVANPGSGEPWEWRTLGVASRHPPRLPNPAAMIQISLKQPVERTFIIFRQEADLPKGGSFQVEGPTMENASNRGTKGSLSR